MPLEPAGAAASAVLHHLLYTFRRCPYAMRARLALHISGVCCELREVVLRDKPAALLLASPKGTVPVLVTAAGDVIDESLDIALWALNQRDPLGWLPRDMASTLALIAQCDGPFKHHLDQYKYPERVAIPLAALRKSPDAPMAPVAPVAAVEPMATTPASAHRDQAAVLLHQWNRLLSDQGFLGGATFGFADMAILPFVRQFAAVDSGWFHAQPWPQLHAWLARWMASDQFAAVMEKHPAWRPGDTPRCWGG